jgi:hypothetical protein
MVRRVRGYRQGDLDGLCGVYAIVNALRYLLRLNRKQCQTLFASLVRTLSQVRLHPYDPLVQGVVFRQLKQLLTVADHCCSLHQGLSFQARPLRLRREDRTLARLWAALDGAIGSGCVAIIGITGRTDHWCVVYRVTPRTLRLLDSSGRSCIRRSRCTVRTARTRYCLELSEILLIER